MGVGQLGLPNTLPEFFMEKVGHGIAGWLDQGDSSTDGRTARHRIADSEGDEKVHSGK